MIKRSATRGPVTTRRLGLAGAGAAAAIATSSAEAGIISSGVVDQVVNPGATPFNLDIDGDSNFEFQFSASTSKSGVRVDSPEVGSEYLRTGFSEVDKLAANDAIGLGGLFSDGFGQIATNGGPGEWVSPYPDSGFMGVTFDLSGNTHYGWIEITANSASEIVLNQWAYEDVADAGILAGDTGTPAVPIPGMGLLFAVAAGGVVMKRFKRGSS